MSLTAYRQCRVTFAPFADDFIARKGEDAVDRDALLAALTDFLKANNLKTDWSSIESAPNEALVNALAMMSPYGVRGKAGAAGSARSQVAGGNPHRGHRNRPGQEEIERRRNAAAVTSVRMRILSLRMIFPENRFPLSGIMR